MNAQFGCVVEEWSADSDASRVSFAEVVGKLVKAGVERYHADLVRAEKAYFLPTGESRVVPSEKINRIPAFQFSSSQVEAAVKAIQRGEISYKTFCEGVMEGGCVGYLVSITGKRVVYYGRSGESHVELFPGAKQD